MNICYYIKLSVRVSALNINAFTLGIQVIILTDKRDILILGCSSYQHAVRGSIVVKALCYKPEGSIPDEVNC
jgi:hypothetical protein